MNQKEKKKHVREPPSVPFIWETKPGIPKKDWKPMNSSFCHIPKTPLKQIASIPFVWEEKPGTPLQNFSHVDVNEVITSLDFEAFSFDTYESFNSVPSLKNSSKNKTCDRLCSPSSPASSETDSSVCSYATGMSSLTGSAFLECLFPLVPPKSGFLGKDVGYIEDVMELKGKNFEHEDRYTCDVSKKQPTLGELIMMSRRRSFIRKAAQINKWDAPKKTTREKAFGCFSIVTRSSVIEGLLKRKYYPRLKLIQASKKKCHDH